MKFFIVFLVILTCLFATVIHSSGISQYYANRDVSMQIADSENALIALPELIILNVNILKLSTNYYSKEMVLKRIEETLTIREIDHNLTIKNNMAQPIYVEQIQFDHPHLQFHHAGLLLGIGANAKMDIINTFDGNDSIILKNTTAKSKATLYFRWDNGNITVQKDVIINATIIEELEDQIEV